MSIDLPFNTAHQSCHHKQIHAPAWGATRNGSTVTQPSSFQSTRPRGARLGAFVQSIQDAKFQSMRPRGARHAPPSHVGPYGAFQSTRPRRRDLGSCRYPRRSRCFNPRAAWDATRRPAHWCTPQTGFNPRARMGRDSRECQQNLPCFGFNPRARVGRDCLLAGQVPTIRQSNLTSKSQQS